MIVRILGDTQYTIDDTAAPELDALDAPLGSALDENDEVAFAAALDAVIAWVRAHGEVVDPATILPSDLLLPAPGTDLDEVRTLLDPAATSE